MQWVYSTGKTILENFNSEKAVVVSVTLSVYPPWVLHAKDLKSLVTLSCNQLFSFGKKENIIRKDDLFIKDKSLVNSI